MVYPNIGFPNLHNSEILLIVANEATRITSQKPNSLGEKKEIADTNNKESEFAYKIRIVWKFNNRQTVNELELAEKSILSS